MATIVGLSAVTLGTRDMSRAVNFYERMGFAISKGGREAEFTTFDAGGVAFNLIHETGDGSFSWWGRLIFRVIDVDGMYDRVRFEGVVPDFAPRDAPWGERYFHLRDPDGHEISFASPISKGIGANRRHGGSE